MSRADTCNPSLRYMPQLDGLRGIGVLVVFAHHFAPMTTRGSEVGRAAMGMFFTLSSYLITTILLRARDRSDRGEITLGQAWRTYFRRRSLRIFPAYFLVLALAYLTDAKHVREHVLWHGAYLSNVLFERIPSSGTPVHFWSLSVEEQFYLAWPLVILFLPRRVLAWAMGAMLVGSVAHRVLVMPNVESFKFGTVSNFDYLGFGGLLALLEHALPVRPSWRRFWEKVPAIALGLAASVLAARYALGLERDTALHVTRVSHAFVAVFLVAGASRGFGGALGWLLERRPVLAVGEISYGAYLIHGFMDVWTVPLYASFDFRPLDMDWTAVVALTIPSLLGAWLSYRLLERPLMRRA